MCRAQASQLPTQDPAPASILDADSQEMLAMLSRPADPAEEAPPIKRTRLGSALTTSTSQTTALPRMVRTASV